MVENTKWLKWLKMQNGWNGWNYKFVCHVRQNVSKLKEIAETTDVVQLTKFIFPNPKNNWKCGNCISEKLLLFEKYQKLHNLRTQLKWWYAWYYW